MKSIVFAALALVSSAAFANHATPVDTTAFGCQELRTIVRKAGPSGRDINGVRVYSDLFGAADCNGSDRSETLWVLDAPGKQCPIGNYCAAKPSWQN